MVNHNILCIATRRMYIIAACIYFLHGQFRLDTNSKSLQKSNQSCFKSVFIFVRGMHFAWFSSLQGLNFLVGRCAEKKLIWRLILDLKRFLRFLKFHFYQKAMPKINKIWNWILPLFCSRDFNRMNRKSMSIFLVLAEEVVSIGTETCLYRLYNCAPL